jgi:hypothetical protein
MPYLNQMIDWRLAYNVNTICVPLPWNVFEPSEGKYDFRMIDSLILKCRAKGMHCIPLWFGTWKNINSYYAPTWLTGDPQAFRSGGTGEAGISPFCTRALEADKRAFHALLGRIKQLDQQYNTVLAVQVENEIGCILSEGRDQQAAAVAAWNAAVPSGLMQYLAARKGRLVPWLEDRWREHGYAASGAWAQVFGDDQPGSQIFMAWYYARYVNDVAASGRAIYDLPMYCNWGYDTYSGPSWQTLDIWQCGAPSVSASAPDIYSQPFEATIHQYNQQGNPMLMPESSPQSRAFGRSLWFFGENDGVMYSAYEGEATGAPRNWNNGAMGPGYALIKEMAPAIAANQGLLPRTLRAFVQNFVTEGVFDGYGITVTPTGSGGSQGIVVLIKMGNNEYVAVGSKIRMDIRRLYDASQFLGVTSAYKGNFANGAWVQGSAVTMTAASNVVSYSFVNSDYAVDQIRFVLSGTPPAPELAFKRPADALSWAISGHPANTNSFSKIGHPLYAVDDDKSTEWLSQTGANVWWQVDLQNAYHLAAVQIVPSATDNQAWRQGFEVQASTTADFASPTVLGSQGATPFAAGSTWTLAVTNTAAFRYVRIRKTDAAATFSFSEVRVFGTGEGQSVVPAAPTNLRLSGNVEVQWQDNANNETGYVVERAASGAGFSPLDTLAANTMSFADRTFVPSTRCNYRVRAFNSAGFSAYSNVDSVMTSSAGSAAITATGVDQTHVRIDFSEMLDSATAKVMGNYALSNNMPVTAIQVSAYRVILTSSAAMHVGQTYSVTISNVKDIFGTTMNAQKSFIGALPSIAVNCAGTAAGRFSLDNIFSGGAQAYTRLAIDVSTVADPAPMEVYQSARKGNSTYTVPNVVQNVVYKLRLHFTEFDTTVAAGGRRFNIDVNGARQFTNLDVVAGAGGRCKALVKELEVQADAGNRVVIVFSKGDAGEPVICGIELIAMRETTVRESARPRRVPLAAMTLCAIGRRCVLASVPFAGSYTIRAMDLSGARRFQVSGQGPNTRVVPIHGLPAGLYVFTLECGTRALRDKVLVTR